MSLRWAGLALASWLALAAPALAARVGTVDVDGTEIFDGPGKGYRLIDKLPKGAQVAASNLPTEGYFKIRTSSGVVGWVQGDSLVLSEVGAGGASMEMPPSPGAPPGMPGPASTAPDFRTARHKNFVRVRLLGGMTFFNAQEVNGRLGFEGLQTGAHVGGEANFMFTPDLAMVVRVEYVVKNLVGEDEPTNKTYQLDLTSFPAMVGLELALSRTPRFSTSFSMMAGLGLQTQLMSTGLDFASPNVTILQDTTFTGLAKLNLSWNFWKSFSLFAEGGYRILKSGELTPSTSGVGSEIFEVNGVVTPVVLDLSGPIAGVGVAIVF